MGTEANVREKQREGARVYLLVGSDADQRSRALAEIVDRFVDPDLADWCVARVDGLESTAQEVVDLASTPPFIGERRVVIVRQAEALEPAEALVPYVESPAAFSVLILIAEAIDRRTRLFQAIQKHGRVVVCEAPAAEEMPRVIARMARDLGVDLEPAALSLLVERTGDDAARARSEIEKLALYAGGRGRITLEEADLLVARGQPSLSQYAVFDFVDALAEGQPGAALSRLDELFRCGEPPLLILAMIGRQFRMLLAATAWQGGTARDLAGEMGLKSEYPARKALAQARRWSVDQLAAAIEACAECDGLIKRGMDGRRALEALTVRLAYKIGWAR